MTKRLMRPSPLVLLALVAVGFALIAVPLARLTRADSTRQLERGVAPGTTATGLLPGADEVAGLVRVRAAHAPLRVTVSQDGRRVAEFGAPAGAAAGALAEPMEQPVVLRWVVEAPLDLLVEATWPDGTPPTALGVEVEPDGEETRRVTVWSDGAAMTELLTFSWK